MNMTVTDFTDTVPIAARLATGGSPPPAVHPQALLELPPGEARESLLAVHGILGPRLPPTGSGSTKPAAARPASCRSRYCVAPTSRWSISTRTRSATTTTRRRRYSATSRPSVSRPAASTSSFATTSSSIFPMSRQRCSGFCESLKQDGLILIGAPNPRSLSGVVTKYSPHWFHVWFYRYVRGEKKAGQPGEAPFPTFFHPLVTLSNLEAFAKTHGLRGDLPEGISRARAFRRCGRASRCWPPCSMPPPSS